jgi:hypothetical protein
MSGDLRMLGTRDGLVHALIWVRNEIISIDGPYRKLDPRHTRKRAERDAVLRPLKALEARLAEAHKNCQAAYDKSCAERDLTKMEAGK